MTDEKVEGREEGQEEEQKNEQPTVFKMLYDASIEHIKQGEIPILMLAVFMAKDGSTATQLYKSSGINTALIIGELERIKTQLALTSTTERNPKSEN